MANVPDYSQYIRVKKTQVSQKGYANQIISKDRVAPRYDGYFPLYRGTSLPPNALLSNKFIIPPSPPLPEFSPLNITGLVGWFDATDASTITFSSGSSVSLLSDKSGNGFNVSQGTVGQQPVLVSNIIGSNPVLRFTQASSTVLTNASALAASLGSGPISLILVERNMTAPSGNPGPFGFNAGPNFGNVFQYNAGYLGGFQPFATSAFTSATGRFDYYNRTNTGSGAIGSINGTLESVNDNATGTYSGAFFIGRGPNGFLSGDIGEIIIYNSNLTTTERQKVEGYVAWKWGLTGNLPVSHPYKLVKPQP